MTRLARCPRRWVLFTDLHVQKDTLPTCVRVLRRVAAEAQSRDAGIICLGDFWHAGGMLHTRQLNRILDEIRRWDMPVLMIPGNHDAALADSVWTHAARLGALPSNLHLALAPPVDPVLAAAGVLRVLVVGAQQLPPGAGGKISDLHSKFFPFYSCFSCLHT
jgi:hypothetical protein